MAAEVDAVVVGAGVAGLAAAAELRARGLAVMLFEAAERMGGRAWTAYPAALGAQPFDHGASWLHDAARNPVVAIARAAGRVLLDAGEVRCQRTFVGSRFASEAESAAYDRAYDRLVAAAEARAANPPGPPGSGRPPMSLADAMAEAADDAETRAWLPTVAAWEGTIIAGADAADLDLIDWRDNLLKGANLAVAGGLGAMVRDCLGRTAGEVRLATPVARIRWQDPGGRVAAETARGTVTARAAIVTVSTGVLATEGVRFSPPLPRETVEAAHALPMGLLTKVALKARGEDRLDLPPFCSIDRRLERADEAAIVFHAWPFGYDHMIGFIGGRAAWALAEAGRAAVEDFARAELRKLFGARADRAFAPGAVVTTWGTDARFRGAYCFAAPGCAAMRGRLGQPLAEGRLVFAGEAVCADGLAGTVGGAYRSGAAAAATVATYLSR